MDASKTIELSNIHYGLLKMITLIDRNDTYKIQNIILVLILGISFGIFIHMIFVNWLNSDSLSSFKKQNKKKISQN